MRLSDFILADMEKILAEWEMFAATLLPAASGLHSLALRDHAPQILEAIARDLNRSQTRTEQSEKSKGRAPKIDSASDTAAQTHAVLRAQHGFDINQLVAEYRALRASVLRLWMDFAPLDKTGVEDMIRFNEAIDQSIVEAVSHFHLAVERYRNLLLGMLGHDMRNPLSAITMTAKYLAQLNAGEKVSEAAERLIRSGASMRMLLDDLTDFNRTSLGLGIKIVPSEVDLTIVAADEVDQFRAAHPRQAFEFLPMGNTLGRWDSARLQQLLRNLLSNAVRYGSPDLPIRVTLRGEQSGVQLEVANSGEIDSADISQLFEPLQRGTTTRRDPREGLGLGLFIVREIAKAHRGEVEACSRNGETTFVVRLPRVVERGHH